MGTEVTESVEFAVDVEDADAGATAEGNDEFAASGGDFGDGADDDAAGVIGHDDEGLGAGV